MAMRPQHVPSSISLSSRDLCIAAKVAEEAAMVVVVVCLLESFQKRTTRSRPVQLQRHSCINAEAQLCLSEGTANS